jgi:hypothetical protein
MRTINLKLVATSLSIAFLLTLGLGLAVPATAAPAEEEEVRETFRANVIGATRGRSTQMDIRISRWTKDDERAGLMEVVMDNDSRALARAVRDQDSVGFLQIRGQRSYRLRYSRQSVAEDGSRTIVLATDRPVAMREATGTTQSMDFSITIAVLHLDAEGNGEGNLTLGNELIFDKDANQLEISNAGTQAIRLTNIRPVN